MTNRNTDSSQGDGGNLPPPPGPTDNQRSRGGNKVYKSGPLFLSSKGIGWTSWKKRWFILTRTSLVFFRNDPIYRRKKNTVLVKCLVHDEQCNPAAVIDDDKILMSAIPQKGSEINLTLGGIDLNCSGSVVVKADKKLLTVLFPDGRDGRTFTLKAETLEDLYEWKAALEEALANAPNTALVMGQNEIFKNDHTDAADGSLEQLKDRQPVKSFVIGQPILLALEDIDGTPSFLEKAIRFLEEHGVKVEGILRQAADVDDVERRIREYEQGKCKFSQEEDPHVIADCVKYVLRELPSPPVPASCCNALLEACRTDCGVRVSAMRSAICETFPEPNRRLLQRILMMMQTVASHKVENRMSTSAVAACMAPLLLRSLLAGDCELENAIDMVGDGSVQLLKAAAAANHAQAIIITLLEDYDNLFGEGSMSPVLYSDSVESGSESEELSDDGETFEDDGDDEETEGSDADVEEHFEQTSSATCSDAGDNDMRDHKMQSSEGSSSGSKSAEVDDDLGANQKMLSCPQSSLHQHDNVEGSENFPNQSSNGSTVQSNESGEILGDDLEESSLRRKLMEKNPSTCTEKSTTISNGPMRGIRRPAVWGLTSAKKNLSMESIDVPNEDETEIHRLEVTKSDVENRIAKEAKGNAILQENLEKHKSALHERRLALEQDVARLQEQLQKECELRTALEAGLKMSQGALPVSVIIDEKMKAELEEIAQAEADVINLKQKADDLGVQLNQKREQNRCFGHDSCNQPEQTPNEGKMKDRQKDFEATDTSRNVENLTRSKKDTHLNKADSDRDTKQEHPSLPNKHLPQNQQSESVGNSKSAGVSTSSSFVEPGIGRPATTNPKKFGTKAEGTNSTTSALSKLTNRLNFLKERRTQIATEIQNFDKGWNSGRAIQKLERGSESQSSEQSRGSNN